MSCDGVVAEDAQRSGGALSTGSPVTLDGQMASDARIRANRANAEKSTGPRSPQGKNAIRNNALKHGLLAKAVVLRDEDEEEFERLLSSLTEELAPAGELESQLVDRIAACAWRLRRILRIETGIFTRGAYDELARRGRAMADTLVREDIQELAALSSKKTILDPEVYEAAIGAAEHAEGVRDSADAVLGTAFVADAAGPDALSKLSRYETMLERAMYRAVAELRHVQALREEGPPALESGS